MKAFTRGLRAGIPIGLGYLSVSFTFGIMAIASGLSWWQAVIISMATLTSAGQLSAIGTMALPGQYAAMLVSQLTINLRYSFMAMSLSQKTSSKFRGVWRWILGFFLTDEIFAVASTKRHKVGVKYFAGLASAPYVGWTLGTLLGALAGTLLPDVVRNCLGLMLYGMFIAIIIPPARRERGVLFAVCVAVGLSCLFHYVPFFSFLSGGFALIISAVVAAALAAWLFPVASPKEDLPVEACDEEVAS